MVDSMTSYEISVLGDIQKWAYIKYNLKPDNVVPQAPRWNKLLAEYWENELSCNAGEK